MNIINKKAIIAVSLVILLIGTAVYFSAQAKDEPEGGSVQQGQAMPVTVEVIKTEPVQIWKNFSARLEAVEFAELRPQVSGVITDIKFINGQTVEKGDVLFVIDTRSYQAEVDRARAELNSAYTEINLAKKELERAKNLVEADAISKRIYDERLNTLKVSQARASSSKAQLEQAKIDLDFANVKAPISGQVSRDEVTVGNLVEAGPNAPLLTTIVSTKGVYADFEVDERTYLREVRNISQEEAKIPVRLKLNDDNQIFEGFVQSFDNRIDTTSGTIRARAFFPNENQILLPGMFANIEMGSASPVNAVLLTERAISTDQDRKFVYVVNEENKATYREVTLGDSVEGERIIISGLNDGDKVITEGIIRIRPDTPVQPNVKDSPKLAKPDTKDMSPQRENFEETIEQKQADKS